MDLLQAPPVSSQLRPPASSPAPPSPRRLPFGLRGVFVPAPRLEAGEPRAGASEDGAVGGGGGEGRGAARREEGGKDEENYVNVIRGEKNL